MQVCTQYEDVLDFANNAIIADRIRVEREVQDLEVCSLDLIMTLLL
jgi:hypothetical protein